MKVTHNRPQNGNIDPNRQKWCLLKTVTLPKICSKEC